MGIPHPVNRMTDRQTRLKTLPSALRAVKLSLTWIVISVEWCFAVGFLRVSGRLMQILHTQSSYSKAFSELFCICYLLCKIKCMAIGICIESIPDTEKHSNLSEIGDYLSKIIGYL